MPINIYLIRSKSKILEEKLRTNNDIHILDVFIIQRFDHRIFRNNIDVRTLFIIDQSDTNTELVIFTGLFIRNLGGQVFITCPSDFKDLLEVMTDIHKKLLEDPTSRTEIIITENAHKKLGDVLPIVKRFEQENL